MQSKKKSDFSTWVIIVCVIGISFCLGIIEGHTHVTNYQKKTVGASVEEYVCSNKGCSFLVEHSNGTRTWIWAPKLVVEEKVGK